MHINLRIMLSLLIPSFTLSACGLFPSYQDISASARFQSLVFPAQPYSDLLLGPDGRLVAFIENYEHPNRLLYFVEGEGQSQELHPAQDPACTAYTDYTYPASLPDGRLGLLKKCATRSSAGGVSGTTYYVVAYDWITGMVEPLVQQPLPDKRSPGSFSWSPDMRRGIQGAQDGFTGINGTLYWLTPTRPEPMQLTLSEDARSYDLGQSYYTRGLLTDGLVSPAAWSPDGSRIAFFASLEAIGKDSARFDSQRYLYFYDVGSAKAARILDHPFHGAGRLLWSPGGTMLAFAEAVNTDHSNLWIFTPQDRRLYLLAAGPYMGGIAWAADSQNLAVIWKQQPIAGESTIREYRVDLSDAPADLGTRR